MNDTYVLSAVYYNFKEWIQLYHITQVIGYVYNIVY